MEDLSILMSLPEIVLPSGELISAQEVEAPPLRATPVHYAIFAPKGAERFLRHRFVRDLEVGLGDKRLTAGEEVNFDERRGILTSLESGELHVRYVGIEHRYDLVVYNPVDRSCRVLSGEGRDLDPEEYRPTCRPGLLPLFSVLQLPWGCELIPLANWAGPIRRDLAEAHAEWVAICRDRLPRVLRKLTRGVPIRVGGYGDSTTAIGNRALMQNLRSGGAERDRIGFFDRLPADTRARQPFQVVDRVSHVMVGWNWVLKRTLEEIGSPVEYENWGVAGTTTEAHASAKEDGDYMHGSHPTRLGAAAASRCDLVVVGFGANEIGGAGVGDRLCTIIDAFLSAGSECLVVSPPPENPGFIDRPAHWRRTHDEVIAAADRMGCAYVPLARLFGPGSEGATGLSPLSYASGNLSNHPGVAEFAAIGGFLSQIFRADRG